MVRQGKRAKNTEQSANGWQGAYAGMITLVMLFFILLYVMSGMDSAQSGLLSQAMGGGKASGDEIIIYAQARPKLEPPGDIPPGGIRGISDVHGFLKSYIEDSRIGNSMEVSQGEDYLFIRFMDDILFQPGSARLVNPDNMAILDYLGYGIRSIEPGINMIAVIGHAAQDPDNPELEMSDINLSVVQANAVLRYLEDKVGVDSGKLVSVGLGKQHPIALSSTSEDAAKNRRIEILISAVNPVADQLSQVYSNH